ncbi:ECF sigma factor [Botrimarina colliarenosi]|uniref:ECF sigma factor n=1 Tax=Botrimarina colliarenosi TaxID=2528001 RepID=A0A5C6A733_9BACT|nr:ECF-type sigma factor [Botrimarina colliarenosi]TWT95802.1 ECF sigma factor [Botrimarina colliarenosi]
MAPGKTCSSDDPVGGGSAPGGSVAHWIEGLRAGDSLAAQNLWSRYFARLAPLAQARLARLARDRTGEDIALSALKSVMIGIRENRFPDLADGEGLWPLLVTITARKAISEQRRQLAERRRPDRECRFDDVQEYLGTEPTPEFAVEVADELERLAKGLGDSDLKRIVEFKLGGNTNDEIAAELGCTSRTITRKLSRIREEWAHHAGFPLAEFDKQGDGV